MRLIRPVIYREKFDVLLEMAEKGDRIILYEGPWRRYWPHPEGCVVEIDGELYINGAKDRKVQQGQFDENYNYPNGEVVKSSYSLILVF